MAKSITSKDERAEQQEAEIIPVPFRAGREFRVMQDCWDPIDCGQVPAPPPGLWDSLIKWFSRWTPIVEQSTGDRVTARLYLTQYLSRASFRLLAMEADAMAGSLLSNDEDEDEDYEE